MIENDAYCGYASQNVEGIEMAGIYRGLARGIVHGNYQTQLLEPHFSI
jgi:hypothetical protein